MIRYYYLSLLITIFSVCAYAQDLNTRIIYSGGISGGVGSYLVVQDGSPLYLEIVSVVIDKKSGHQIITRRVIRDNAHVIVEFNVDFDSIDKLVIIKWEESEEFTVSAIINDKQVPIMDLPTFNSSNMKLSEFNMSANIKGGIFSAGMQEFFHRKEIYIDSKVVRFGNLESMAPEEDSQQADSDADPISGQP